MKVHQELKGAQRIELYLLHRNYDQADYGSMVSAKMKRKIDEILDEDGKLTK